MAERMNDSDRMRAQAADLRRRADELEDDALDLDRRNNFEDEYARLSHEANGLGDHGWGDPVKDWP